MLKALKRAFSRKPSADNTASADFQRGFHAAQMTHLTASWATSGLSADAELRNDLPAMRARCRSLANDNDYMRNFLRMVGTNVVGHKGFSQQLRIQDPSGQPDQLANNAIEQAFARWSKRGTCDVTGKLSFATLQRLAVRTVARDGEALVRKVRDTGLNGFGFGLQIIAIDRLDTTLNQHAANGNVIRMGVELNSYGRAVAYHLLTSHPGDGVYRAQSGQRYERVPAEDIVHLFIQEDPEQTRGIPWAVSAMTRLNHLGAFEEAAVIASRIGASKMGWYKRADGSPLAGLPGAQQGVQGDFLQEAIPGEFGVLPDGYDFVGFNPDYPHQNYGPFTSACLRGVTAGFGVSYHSLTNDLEGANYSSLRAGTIAEREEWKTLQCWFAEALLENVFEDWLRMSLLLGAIRLPNGTALPASKFDKFNAVEWQGRRWPWTDPVKDMQAHVLAIDNNLSTRRKVMAEQGEDFADIAAQLALEKELLEELGLAAQAAKQPPADPPDDEETE